MGPQCVLEEYVEDNYYARFNTRSYHLLRETHYNARLDVNNARMEVKSQQSHWGLKSKSRAPGHSVCLKSMSRTTTMQGLTLAATCITASEKHILMLDST